MKVYDAQSLRNVALVGHSGAGKTQLLSALLFAAGAVNRFGRVDDGTTVTDFDEEEIARKHTLSASLAYVEWNRNKINFIDTSGMANFLSDARASLRVADAALVVIDAVIRLLPGAIDDLSTDEESFQSGLLEYPQYTRPPSFRGMDVPEILTSGDHGAVARWRAEQATARTRERRPDLLPPAEEG